MAGGHPFLTIEPAITFTISRRLIAKAAEQGCGIKVTVQGPRRILARLDEDSKGKTT